MSLNSFRIRFAGGQNESRLVASPRLSAISHSLFKSGWSWSSCQIATDSGIWAMKIQQSRMMEFLANRF